MVTQPRFKGVIVHGNPGRRQTLTLPQSVTSPQDRWRLIGVLYDDGPSKAAIAFGEWEGRPAIGMRWNGSDRPGDSLGNPQSSGQATWFILPSFVAAQVVAALVGRLKGGDQRVSASVLQKAATQFAKWLESDDCAASSRVYLVSTGSRGRIGSDMSLKSPSSMNRGSRWTAGWGAMSTKRTSS